MLNVFDYIKNYCEVHGFDKVSYKSLVLTKKDWRTDMSFAPGIAFFYKIRAVGEIRNIADISLPFLGIDTPTDYWNIADIATIHDDGALQRLECDFPFICDGIMKLDLHEGASSLFARIDTLQLYYIYVSVLGGAKAKNGSRVYDIEINRKL